MAMHSILDSEAGTSAGLKSIDQTIKRLTEGLSHSVEQNFQLANVLTSHIRRTPMIDPKTGAIDEHYYRDEIVKLFSMTEEDRFSYLVGMIEYTQHQGEDPTLTSDDDYDAPPPPRSKGHPVSPTARYDAIPIDASSISDVSSFKKPTTKAKSQPRTASKKQSAVPADNPKTSETIKDGPKTRGSTKTRAIVHEPPRSETQVSIPISKRTRKGSTSSSKSSTSTDSSTPLVEKATSKPLRQHDSADKEKMSKTGMKPLPAFINLDASGLAVFGLTRAQFSKMSPFEQATIHHYALQAKQNEILNQNLGFMAKTVDQLGRGILTLTNKVANLEQSRPQLSGPIGFSQSPSVSSLPVSSASVGTSGGQQLPSKRKPQVDVSRLFGQR